LSGEYVEKREIFGFVEFGFFLVLVGFIFALTPNLHERVLDFFRDFKLEEFSPGVFLPAPRSSHPVLYNAFFQFSLVYALFQVAMLAARFLLKEPIDRKVGGFSEVIFWLGIAAASNLLKDGGIDWFTFIGCVIILVGVVIIVKSMALLCSRLRWKKHA